MKEERKQKVLSSFMTTEEKALTIAFMEKGYLTAKAEDRAALDEIQQLVAKLTSEYLGITQPSDTVDFLENLHTKLDAGDINNLRLHVFRGMNQEPWLRKAYFSCARKAVETLVGNELAMQKNINLSIQMPEDTTSVLPVHADVWSGDSPYEIVLWIPYVNVTGTKCMFILPEEKNEKHISQMEQHGVNSISEIMDQIGSDLDWVEMAYGEVMLFTQNLMHGNVTNVENTTRWSSNCRFKSVLSPYSDKKLGEFFEPISIRGATVLGADYKMPDLKS